MQVRAQQVIASDIDALEERMWHDVNEYQLSLQQHLSDRDGLLNKIDRASQQLLLLKVGLCGEQWALIGHESGCTVWYARAHVEFSSKLSQHAEAQPFSMGVPVFVLFYFAFLLHMRLSLCDLPPMVLAAQSTNVLNDTFRIWHDGPFGTISGFRLGRTPEHPVDWNEINAAWGQAVLLLHTMAQQCKLNFSCEHLPNQLV